MDRRSALLQGIDLSTARGLEIGPLTAAVVSKELGNVEYIDHLNTEQLRHKYSEEPGIDTSKIPAIDHVLIDGKLPDCLIGGHYDYIVASHVFEHLPNPLGWLRDCGLILRPGGCLAMAIPDKRFTFDLSRSLTTLSELIESDRLDQRRPSPRQIFDAATTSSPIQAGITWQRPPNDNERPKNGPDVDAFGLLKVEEGLVDYLDVHCTVFTPHSLLTLLARTARLNLHPFRLRFFHDTHYNAIEFYLQLETASTQTPDERAASFLSALTGCWESDQPWQRRLRFQERIRINLLSRSAFQLRRAWDALRSAPPFSWQPGVGSINRDQPSFSPVQRASAAHWERVLAQGTSGLRLHWWEDTTTLRHINMLVCGSPLEQLHAGFHRIIVEKLLASNPRTTIRALSVGCGTGAKEIDLIRSADGRLKFAFHCFDVSSVAIECATNLALQEGLDQQISFKLADAFSLDLGEEWDLVYWNNSLHHMLDTAQAIAWSSSRLRQGGLFAMDDYVGPDRFQWSDATIQRATLLLQSLTIQQRADPHHPQVILRETAACPPIDHVIRTDPTEAADSSNILPALQRQFGSTLEWIPTGGLAYFICLDGLFENFQTPQELHQLQQLLQIDAAWARTVETAYAVAFAVKE